MTDFFGMFRAVFGLPQGDDRNHRDGRENEDVPFQRFNIYTDPLEMHRYFENQINEVFRMFTEIGGGFSPGAFLEEPSSFPRLPDSTFVPSPSDSGVKKDIRDEYLKPGFKQWSSNQQRLSDDDLDNKISSEDLGSFLNDKNKETQLFSDSPSKKLDDFQCYSYGIKMVITQHPDGTVEKRVVQRDHLGNEENTIEVTKPNCETSMTLPDYNNNKGLENKKRWPWNFFAH